MKKEVKIGIIGDFNPGFKPHHATNEVLKHGAGFLDLACAIEWIPTPDLDTEEKENLLQKFDALWCSPGSPYKSLEGALNGVRFGREKNVPLMGSCAGFQHIVLEYARNVMGIREAQSEEYEPEASTLFISKLECSVAGKTLGIQIKKDTFAYDIYGRPDIKEHYYCNFGLNPKFQEAIDNAGLKVAGIDETGEARIVELPGNDFLLGTLFVPELFSEAAVPHPIATSYLKAAILYKETKIVNTT